MTSAAGEVYATIPHTGSNRSILSNENNPAREASAGSRRWVVVGVSIASAALITLGILAFCLLAFPNSEDREVSEKPDGPHATHFDKHLRIVKILREREDEEEAEEAEKKAEREASIKAAVAAAVTNTSTQTLTSTSTVTSTQTSTTTEPDPILFCFAIMRDDEDEISLMREQLAKGAGIYGCDDWSVFSDTKTWLSPGPPTRLETAVVDAHLSASGHGNITKEPNAMEFLKVWDRIRVDGRYRDSTWVVKVDPDTVFFPQRLKANLQRARRSPTEPVFFANCQPEGHSHFMFGAIEVFSTSAVEVFFEGSNRCLEQLEADHMWEERYMSHCLRYLEVPMAKGLDLLQDEHCDPGEHLVPCIADAAVAFHPLQKPSDFFLCHDQATTHWKELQKKADEAEARWKELQQRAEKMKLEAAKALELQSDEKEGDAQKLQKRQADRRPTEEKAEEEKPRAHVSLEQ